MINTEILREYDIRGIFQKSLTLEDVKKISFKLAKIIKETNDNKIIIGHDGRASSLEIKNTLIENFLSFGIDVYDISLIPTPISYFANKYFEISNLYISDQPKILIDDYGHHPIEISATIQAIRQKFPRKKICMIFEPHRYTRTQQLFNDFVKVLSKVDCLLLLDIYPASEKKIKGISSKKLISEITKKHKNAEYLGKLDPLIWLQSNYKNFSILITQGAGTISKLNQKIKNKWQ